MLTRRAKRWITWGATAIVFLTVGGFLVASWLQAGTLRSEWLEITTGPSDGSAVVAGVSPGSIDLAAGDGVDRPGMWGLAFDGGRAVVGSVTATDGDRVSRQLIELTGALSSGTPVAFDRSVWPLEAAGELGFGQVFVPTDDGALPAWTIDGFDDTWVLFIHGTGATPAEGFRLATAVGAAGFPVLIPSYRGDRVEDQRATHGFGYDEWRDIDAAVRFAVGREAADVVLVGYGSGASIVGAYLAEARQPERVAGVILDGPLLDLASLIDAAWLDRGVPGWALGWTKAIASARFGVEFGALNHLDDLDMWSMPLLIVHGRNDTRYPLAASEDLAIALGDEALLLTFPEAGPGQSWNVARDRYEAAAIGFLEEVARGRSRIVIAGS